MKSNKECDFFIVFFGLKVNNETKGEGPAVKHVLFLCSDVIVFARSGKQTRGPSGAIREKKSKKS